MLDMPKGEPLSPTRIALNELTAKALQKIAKNIVKEVNEQSEELINNQQRNNFRTLILELIQSDEFAEELKYQEISFNIDNQSK